MSEHSPTASESPVKPLTREIMRARLRREAARTAVALLLRVEQREPGLRSEEDGRALLVAHDLVALARRIGVEQAEEPFDVDRPGAASEAGFARYALMKDEFIGLEAEFMSHGGDLPAHTG